MKIKVVLVAMLLSLVFTWSCQKEGSMTPDASGNQSKSLTDAEKAFIADLEAELKQTEANFDANAQGRANHKNPNNPYDYSGERHKVLV